MWNADIVFVSTVEKWRDADANIRTIMYNTYGRHIKKKLIEFYMCSTVFRGRAKYSRNPSNRCYKGTWECIIKWIHSITYSTV